jgi:hypothetical protein
MGHFRTPITPAEVPARKYEAVQSLLPYRSTDDHSKKEHMSSFLVPQLDFRYACGWLSALHGGSFVFLRSLDASSCNSPFINFLLVDMNVGPE